MAEGANRRSWTYPLVGALLALGAPLGFLVLRSLMDEDRPTLSWALGEIQSDPLVYSYLLFSTLVVFVVLGVVLGHREDRLEQTSVTDALTGLANRRYFNHHLDVELRRRERYASSLSVLLIDVDSLKSINDRWGHRAGDAALRRVADALRATCRTTDVPARYGGDEFMVLAPSTSAAEALELAERLRRVLDREAEASEPGAHPRVSIGIAGAGAGSGSAELLEAADQALYEAKAAGRDRAVVSRPPAQIGSEPLGAKG
jgi:diguanylate cyclase (GGDEF)-like protein